MTIALVVGSGGQDGTILRERLVAEGIGVVGIRRDRLESFGLPHERVEAVDVLDPLSVGRLVAEVRPDEVYYLAAHHHSSEDVGSVTTSALLALSFDVHVQGFAHVLEAVERDAPNARTFYAASSHVFGEPATSPQDESTPFAPTSAYAITKVAGVELARLYRRRGMHVSAGYLFNHESPLRAERFVSTRIVRGAVDAAEHAARGERSVLELGSLSAVVDWGWAPDYVDAMRRIVRHASADDYVVATGEAHTTRDFCEVAFRCVGLEYAKHVRERGDMLTRAVPVLLGDSSRLRRATGWAPSVDFAEMVARLVWAERARRR